MKVLVGTNVIVAALIGKQSDFEDCLQDECAVSAGADYIVTRNIKDFLSAKVKAILPEDFLKLNEL